MSVRGSRRTGTKREQIITIAEHSDLTNREIAALTGASTSTTDHVLAEYRSSTAAVQAFTNNRPAIFTSLQKQSASKIAEIIDSLKPEELDTKGKTFAINALNNVLGTSYDKERLETGKSTSNIEAICVAIDEMQDRKWRKANNDDVQHE